MKFNGCNNFEDFARACGYTNCNDSSGDNQENQFNNMGCNDIPNGFQALNPQLFVIIGEIFADIIAGNLPSNVQNALGNWIELVGQAILTYSAQQQYFQSGPGRYFNPIYYNVDNQFCQNTSENSTGNTSSNTGENTNSNVCNNRKKSNKKSSSKSNETNKNYDEIKELKNTINDLMKEIEEIKDKINNIKN